MATCGTVTNHSPRHSAGNDNTFSQSRLANRAVPSPWNQIVRGEYEPISSATPSPSALACTDVNEPCTTSSSSSATASAVPGDDSWLVGEGSRDGNGSNGNAGKRLAWNTPSNGATVEVGPVMGAVLWPALSESTRATFKSPSEPSKGLTDGSSVSPSQGTGIINLSSQRQVSGNANTIQMVPARQLSMRQNDYGPSSSGSHMQQSPAGPIVSKVQHNSTPKEHTQRSGFGSQSHNDHPHQRNSYRNRNSGSNQRDHHSYGGRREQDRGNQDWNARRSFNGRDNHMSPRAIPRFARHPLPPSSIPFIPQPPVRPFGGSMGFPELSSPVVYFAAPPPESLRGVPFVTPLPPHAVFFPALDPHLPTKILNQIDYYFSNENLIKDIYLRKNMDEHGWVPIKLIAGFKKVIQLTDNIQLILDALRTSSIVEVQGDKVRRRDEWRRWIMPPSVQFPTVTGPQTPGISSPDSLAEQVQSITLEKCTNKSSVGLMDVQADALQNKSLFRDFNSQSQQSSDHVVMHGSSDHPISAGN